MRQNYIIIPRILSNRGYLYSTKTGVCANLASIDEPFVDICDYLEGEYPKKAEELTPLEIAKYRHEQRTPEQIENIKNRWQQSRIKVSFSPEIIANNSILNNTLPVSQGQPMTFREADEMRANPYINGRTRVCVLGYIR